MTGRRRAELSSRRLASSNVQMVPLLLALLVALLFTAVTASTATAAAPAAAAPAAAAAAAAAAVPPTAYPPSQLRRNASCVAAGLEPDLKPFRQVLPLPDIHGKGAGHEVFAPLFASSSLSPTAAPDATVRQAVVFIHGAAGDANVYFCDGFAAAAKAAPGTLVIAPWFGKEQLTAAEWTGRAAAGPLGSAFYASTPAGGVGWLGGGDNAGPVPFTTSFDVLDAIVNTLGAARAEGRFPSLERVVVNGFSAGGQMVSRWAVFSPPSFVGGLPARVIAADGSSYMYLDATRPAPPCSPLYDTGTDHSCGEFVIPVADGGANACAGYDEYKYGLQVTAAAAESSMYLAEYAASPTKLAAAVSAFLHTKDVRFIFGARDVCNCNIEGYTNRPDACYHSNAHCTPNTHGGTVDGHSCCDTWPDTATGNLCAHTCEAMLQGSNRLQRGINYVSHLRKLSGSPEHPLMGFFNGGHNNSG